MNVYEWRNQFFERHGGYESAIVELDRTGEETGFLLFPDGAKCETWPEGACQEPPQNEAKRLKRVVRYREQVLQAAEHAFTDLKQKIAALHGEGQYDGFIAYQQDGFDLNDKQEAMQALKRARVNVLDRRRDLALARQQLHEATKPNGRQRQLQRETDLQIERQEERFREELKRMRI